jgi:hypothetical protein
VENDPVDRTDPTGEQLVEHNPDDHEIVTRVNAVASTTQAQTLHLDAQNTVTMQRSGSLVSVRLTHTEQTKSFMGVSIKVSVAFTGRGTISQRPGEVKVRDINLRSNSLLATVQSSPKELVFRNERNGSVGIHSDGPLIISTPTKPVVIPPLNIIANPPKKKEDERK